MSFECENRIGGWGDLHSLGKLLLVWVWRNFLGWTEAVVFVFWRLKPRKEASFPILFFELELL